MRVCKNDFESERKVVMSKGLNVKEMESLINEILPGLTMYVRDVNLPAEIAAKYETGMIIREKGFTDASNRVMGMVTTHRYAILSNHMGDMREYEHDTNWGLFVAKNNSHFKVLDVYEYQGKTQILLLHLPDDNRWSMFENVKLSIEDEFIPDCRRRFENKCLGEAVPELTTEVWLDRCSFPIGMSDDGEFFENEIRIDEMMKPIKAASFRQFYHRLVYIRCPEILKRLEGGGIEIVSDSDGVIAYGYIDEQCGLSFHVFGAASVKNGVELVRGSKDEKAMLLLRRGSVAECEFVGLDEIGVSYPEYDSLIKMVRDNYDTENEAKEEMRRMDFLDGFRNDDYPDDVAVVIFSEGLQPEQVWMRCCDVTEEMLYGTLLNEPNQDYGVHEWDRVGFVPIKREEGLLLVAFIER